MADTDIWFKSIDNPRFVVAPMVDASELAWRLLTRKHGAQLCYSPMFHSAIFTKDPKYRKDSLQTSKEDRPLIIQFCGNNPEIMAEAAKLAEGHCDAIDVNLGCPQAIAKRGKYGSFLQDDWELLKNIVSAMSKAVSIPITCKIRVFDSIERTISYAQMLQDAGCRLLTVHGRTREQKGPFTGVASWDHIRAVKKAISIPMFANGNIQCIEDVHRCLDYTGVDGVMSAEGILTNPCLYEGVNPITWDVVEEYLDFVEIYPCPTSYIRGHLFKIFHKIFLFEENNECREILATGQNLDDFRKVCTIVKDKYTPYHEGLKHFEDNNNITRISFDLILPPWICQPYIRITPEEHKQKLAEHNKIHNEENTDQTEKRHHEDQDGNPISRKKMKKLRRIMRRPLKAEQVVPRSGEICLTDMCPNPLGGKCGYKLCKKCCRDKCFEETKDCIGHRIHVKTRREMAMKYAQMKSHEEDIKNEIKLANLNNNVPLY